jgi:NitT/TauT family transport system substrate-binding protein
MSNIKLIVRAGGLALAVAFAFAPPAAAQALKPWTHAVIEPKGDAGFSLMVTRPGFADKYGLQVKIVSMKNGGLAHKALLSGEVDSIESSPGSAILAGLRGADLKIVGCDWPGVLHGLMTKTNIATVADLKGKTVGISAPGSLPDLVGKAILNKYGVDVNAVKYASLGSDLDRYKALLAGVVDASVVTEELMSVAPKDVKLIAAGRDALPMYVRLCLTMTGKTIAARRDDAVHFLAAQIAALRFAVSHRDATIALTRETVGLKPDDKRAPYVFDVATTHHDIDPEITIPMEKLDWMQHELVKTGNLKAAGDLHKITDATLRADALKLVGK